MEYHMWWVVGKFCMFLWGHFLKLFLRKIDSSNLEESAYHGMALMTDPTLDLPYPSLPFMSAVFERIGPFWVMKSLMPVLKTALSLCRFK